ncbi:queuosine salvage family protein [Thermodesulfobacteriota bacterium]
MFEVLETARTVAEKSRLVRINQEALHLFARDLLEKGCEIPPWDDLHHFCDGGQETVAYFLVLDSINFCFWPPKGKDRWEIDYGSGRLSGYHALAVSLKSAVKSGTPITRANFLAKLSTIELKDILGGYGELQLLERRREILNEVGRCLIHEYDGQAHRLVESAKGSAATLVRLLSEKISSFRDVADYQGTKTLFYKRAQILTADLFGAFQGSKWGNFQDINELTAFADYKVPQVLRHLGILSYKSSLSKRVDRMITLQAGSGEEVEIRANTIWAVELIRRELARMGKSLRAFEVDWMLWNLGQQEAFKSKPYHRTVTIFY